MHHTQKWQDKNQKSEFLQKIEHFIWKYKNKSGLPAQY